MSRIILMGGFGGDNLGDELICLSMISSLAKVCPEKDIKIFTFDADVSRKNFPGFEGEFISYCCIWDFFQIVKNLIRFCFLGNFKFRRGDVVVIGGGGLFYEYRMGHLISWFSRVLYLRLIKVDYLIHANSFHSPKGRLGSFLIRKIIEWARSVTVRDSLSFRNLHKYGVTKNVGLCNDVVFGIPAEKKVGGGGASRRRVAFVLRPWAPYGEGQVEFWAEKIQEALHLSDGVDLLCFDLREDVSFAHAIREHVGIESLGVKPISADMGVESILSVISGYAVVVSMRFHGLVLSIMAGVPVLSIAYDDKVLGLCSDLGLADFCKVLQGEDLAWDNLAEVLDNIRSKEDSFLESCERLKIDKSYEYLLVEAVRGVEK